MAVQLLAPNSMRPEDKKKKKHTLDIIIIILIVLLCIGGIIFMLFGFSDYSEMKDMETTWADVVDVANTADPEMPPVFLEYQVKPVDLDASKNPENTGSINSSIIISGILVPPEKEEMTVVNTEDKIVTNPENNTEKIEEDTTPEVEVDYLYRSINLEALRKINSDVSGYIYIPNTRVDYPILKETVPYSYYYLTHDINHKVDKYGSIFELTDEERRVPKINNAVNIIFGHNMRSGAMFAGVTNYKYQGYSSNPVYIYRDNYRIEYMPFAFCTVDCYDSLYDFDAFELGSVYYQELLDWIMSKNTVKFNTSAPSVNEPIIVLSTCRDANSNVRQIVCLREVRKAIVPEYYDTLQEVYQYGGNTNGIVAPSN